jgi:hypothetical protein
MAVVEKIGNQYRMQIGTSDQHEIWQMMPADWTPSGDDTIVGLDLEPVSIAPPVELTPEPPHETKKTKHAK